MNVIRAAGLGVLLLFLVGVYLASHRYQVTATNQTLFIVDHFTGGISAYVIAPREEQIEVLKVHLVATTK